MEPKANSYEVITNVILEMLDQGVVPWRQSWHDVRRPTSLTSGRPYRGLNVMLLACIAAMNGFSSPYWLTFNQIKERGGSVQKGTKSTPVVFWKLWERPNEKAETEEEDKDVVPVLRYYRVFNVEQCTGIEAPPVPEAPIQEFTPLEICEQVLAEMPRPPTLKHQGFQPCYNPDHDEVIMPQPEYFHTRENYYAVLFHEVTHATGHPDRLNRQASSSYKSPAYAREELVAEMGSAFLCGHCHIEKPILTNAAAYIQSWRHRLSDDPKLVVMAGAQAQKAADYVLNRGDRE
jgi:antirestriction protein ArdC